MVLNLDVTELLKKQKVRIKDTASQLRSYIYIDLQQKIFY